jgi:type I restriction enzyme S subunit
MNGLIERDEGKDIFGVSQPASIPIETLQSTFTRSNLPSGWRKVRLGDVCEIIAGQSPPGETYRKTPEGLPFFQGKADFGERHPIARTWCISPNKIALPGDILISVRAPVGPTNVADVECCIGRGLAVVRPLEIADLDFILAALRFYESALAKLGSGSTFGAINRDVLESLEIPLPSLGEQKRIAAVLNEQMATVKRARAAAEAQLKAAKDLPAAYLREVFDSANIKHWESKPLGEVGEIVSGLTLGRKFNPAANIKVPYLRVANVKDGHLDLTDVYDIEATASEVEKLRLKFGDLLLTEGGDRDKLGRGTFWEEQLPLCLHQNHIFRVRFNLTRYSPHFVSAQAGSPYGKAYFLAHAKQTTGIATINQQVLSKFPLLSPSLSEQTRIATQLSEKTVANSQMITNLETQLDTIKKIPAALLRQAFTGKI